MRIFKQAAKYGAVIVAGTAGIVGTASAALDSTALGTVMAAVQTDAQTAFDAVLPVIGVVLGLVIGLKLFKRFANKV